MSFAEHRRRIADLQVDIRERHHEIGRSRRDFDAYLAGLIQRIRRGHPTAGIDVDEGKKLLTDVKRGADRLLHSLNTALDVIKTATLEVKRYSARHRSIIESVRTLVPRAQRAKAAGDVSTITAILKERARLLLEFQEGERDFEQFRQLLQHEEDWILCLDDVRTIIGGNKWIQDVELIEKLTSPPALAAFLLAAVSKPSLRDGVIGDAEEMFNKNCDEHGRYWAIGLYWVDTLRSIGPLVLTLLRQAVWIYLFSRK